MGSPFSTRRRTRAFRAWPLFFHDSLAAISTAAARSARRRAAFSSTFNLSAFIQRCWMQLFFDVFDLLLLPPRDRRALACTQRCERARRRRPRVSRCPHVWPMSCVCGCLSMQSRYACGMSGTLVDVLPGADPYGRATAPSGERNASVPPGADPYGRVTAPPVVPPTSGHTRAWYAMWVCCLCVRVGERGARGASQRHRPRKVERDRRGVSPSYRPPATTKIQTKTLRPALRVHCTIV